MSFENLPTLVENTYETYILYCFRVLGVDTRK